MRYIDSSSRNPAAAVATWLAGEDPGGVGEFRWQSGYFAVDGLAAVAPVLERLARDGRRVAGVIGSNDGSTVQGHVAELVRLIGLPRPGASLGVAFFEDGLYHPKTYHITRQDGSQAAFVGSANLTASGLGAKNVEAGMLLDTRDGDAEAVLAEIAAAVDGWFEPPRDGLELVRDPQDVDRLVQEGVLCAAPVPRQPRPAGAPGAGPARERPRLGVPVPLRWPPGGGAGVPAAGVAALAPPAAAGPLLAVPQEPFPDYVLFAPGQQAATVGGEALSGNELPDGAVGVILRLNRDAARLWNEAGQGTANVSVPLLTVPTFRFGMAQGRQYLRPRAEFHVAMRFLSDAGIIGAPLSHSAIMLYGYLPGETSSQDVRLNISSTPTAHLLGEIREGGLPVPRENDVAYVEWPTAEDPTIRLTFLARGSAASAEAEQLLATATEDGRRAGRKTCWLEAGRSPPW